MPDVQTTEPDPFAWMWVQMDGSNKHFLVTGAREDGTLDINAKIIIECEFGPIEPYRSAIASAGRSLQILSMLRDEFADAIRGAVPPDGFLTNWLKRKVEILDAFIDQATATER